LRSPVQTLCKGISAFEHHVRDDGELIDPVIGHPFQYGTPYHAYVRAVLAKVGPPDQQSGNLAYARKGLDAALRHVETLEQPATVASVDKATGELGRLNHRDFFWSPILKTYRLLRELKCPSMDAFATRIRGIQPLKTFHGRPPENWAMVWLRGEWMRICDGMGGLPRADFDALLKVFFQGDGFVPETGFFHERGHPNSYDLFTRYFLLEIQSEALDGPIGDKAKSMLASGLKRSLALQLSDGSLHSAYRSSGQTWTDGVQIAYFDLASRLLPETEKTTVEQAKNAAALAYASFTRFFRADGSYSPVQNALPAAGRVGYEGYTADANYSCLALGFLADAVQRGFSSEISCKVPEATRRQVDGNPLYRSVLHKGPYSVHLNAFPSTNYDGVGLNDLTIGPSRYLHWASAARSITGTGGPFCPGLARRRQNGRVEAVQSVSHLGNAAPLEWRSAADWLHMRVQPRGESWHYSFRLGAHRADRRHRKDVFLSPPLPRRVLRSRNGGGGSGGWMRRTRRTSE